MAKFRKKNHRWIWRLYVRSRSTNDAVTEFVKSMLLASNENKYFITMFPDLSKAFDIINYNILFNKLDRNGIPGLALIGLRVI